MTKAGKILLRILITLVTLVYVFHKLDLAGLRTSLAQIDLRYVPVLSLLAAISWFLKARRVSTLLPASQITSISACLKSLLVGMLYNVLLPLRGGDLLRCVLLKRLSRAVSLRAAIVCYVNEKILEITAIAVILAIWLCSGTGSSTVARSLGYLLATGGMAVLGAWFAIPRVSSSLLATQFMFHLSQKFGIGDTDETGNLWPLPGNRGIFTAFLETAVIRAVDAGSFYILLLAVGLPAKLSLAFIVMAAIALGTAVPAAPGFIGTYDAAAVIALGQFGIGRNEAVAYALISHAWFLLTWIVLGLASLISVSEFAPFTARR